MRIGYLSCFSKWHTEPEIADHLELLGHRVGRYHWACLKGNQRNQRNLLEHCGDYDFLLTALPQDFSQGFWRKARERTRIVTWYFDWIREWGREMQYLPRLREFDLVLSTDGFGSQDEWYREAGVTRKYLPHACDTRTFHPVEPVPEYGCDVAFVGHAYFPRRRELLDALARGFNFRHYGQRSCVYGPTHAQICNSAKIMVADNFTNDVPGYWSDRVYLEVGSGGFVLHPRVAGIEKHFEDGRHLVLYESIGDLIDKVDYYLDHEDERAAIASAGWKHVHKYHSQEARVKEFLDICNSTLGVGTIDRKVSCT